MCLWLISQLSFSPSSGFSQSFFLPLHHRAPNLVSHLRGALGNYMGLFELDPSIWGQSSAARRGQPSQAAWTAGFGVEENSAVSHLREVLRVAGPDPVTSRAPRVRPAGMKPVGKLFLLYQTDLFKPMAPSNVSYHPHPATKHHQISVLPKPHALGLQDPMARPFPCLQTGLSAPGASHEVGGRKDVPGQPRTQVLVMVGMSSLVSQVSLCKTSPPWSRLSAAGGGKLVVGSGDG